MPDIKYFITTGDGQNHQVSEDNIKNYGIDSYANAYKDATIRMRNDKGEDYHVPLTNYNDAVEQGLHPFRFDAAPQKSQHSDGNPPQAGKVAREVVQEYENSVRNNTHLAQPVEPKNVPPYLNRDQSNEALDRSSWTNNDFAQQGVDKVHDINTNIQKQQVQDSKPIVNSGNAEVNKYIIKTQGQQRQQAEASANNLNNKFISPYIDEALTSADKQARDVIDKSQHLFYGASTGLPQGDVYHAAGMEDPDKILKGLQENISKVYSNPAFIQNVNAEANKIGISAQDYYSKYVQPKIQTQLESTFEQKEIFRHMPKNKAEYLINGLTNGITGMVLSRLLPVKELQYMNAAQQATDEGHNPNYTPTTGDKLEKFAVSFTSDAPFFGLTGKIASSTVGAVVKKQIAKMTAKGLAEGTARSIVGAKLESSVGKRIASKIMHGSLSGATNLGTYNIMSESARQFRDREFSPGQILERGASGAGTGAALGVTGGVVGGLTSKLSGAKKLVASAANYLIESGTFTVTGEAEKYLKGEGKDIKWGQDFLENMEQLGVMKATGGHFMQRMKNLVRPEIEGVHFTKDEIDHIKTSQSASSLFSALSDMQPADSKFIKGENTESIKDPNIQAKRENLSKAYTGFMEDPNNTFAEKQKVALTLGGTVPKNMPLETGYELDINDNGSTVTTIDANGNAVNRLNFKTVDEANNYLSDHQNRLKANDVFLMANNYPEESQRLFGDFIRTGYSEDEMAKAISGTDKTQSGTKILNDFQSKLSGRISQANSFGQGLLTTDPQGRHEVKAGLDEQTANVSDQFKDEPDLLSSLNDDPESTIQKMRDESYSEDKINSALNYLNAKNTYAGMIKGVRDEIDDKVNQNNEKINSITNQSDGLLHPAKTKGGDPAYIVSGNVVLYEDGAIDHNSSDKSIIIKDSETGEQKMISTTQLESIDQTINAEEYRQQQEGEMRSYFAKQVSDEIEGNVQPQPAETYSITDQDGTAQRPVEDVQPTDGSIVPTPEAQLEPDGSSNIEKYQPYLSDDGKTIIPAQLEDGSEVFLKNLNKDPRNKYGNVDIIYKDEDGNPQNESIPSSYIRNVEDPQIIEDYAKAKEESIESDNREQPIVEIPVTETPSEPANDGIVRDEKGIPLYEQSPIESTISDMKKQGADENDILDYSSNMISDLDKESKALSKKKPEFSRDFATYKANKQALADQREAIEKQKAYWKSLNDAISKPAEPTKAESPSLNKTTETPVIPTDSKPRNTGKYVKENKQMGDYLNLHDRVLRGIASGTKFLWNDDGIKRGLSTELGFKGSEGERRKRIGILASADKGGISIDELAHSIWEEREGQPWQNDDVTDIKNEIISVLSGHNGTRTMIDEAMKAHEQPEYDDDSYEAQNYIGGFANSRHIDPEDIREFDSYTDDTTEKYDESASDDELNSIFAEKFLADDENNINNKEDGQRQTGEIQEVRRPIPGGEESPNGSTGGDSVLQEGKSSSEGSTRQSSERRSSENDNARPDKGSKNVLPDGYVPRAGEDQSRPKLDQYEPTSQAAKDKAKELDSEIEKQNNAVSKSNKIVERKREEISSRNGLFGDTKSTELFNETSDLSSDNLHKALDKYIKEYDFEKNKLDTLLAGRDKMLKDIDDAESKQVDMFTSETPEEANVKRMSDIEERLSDIDSQIMSLEDEGITESPEITSLNEEKSNIESEYKGLKEINSESKRIQDSEFTPPYRENETPLEYAQKVADAHERYKEEQKTNTNPSEAQKEAGNYKKGHIKLDGYDISIENPKGSERAGKDADGTEWRTKMNNTYGYIRGTEGVDGDHIDVYLSDDPTKGDVYVVDQVNPKTQEFDEHKVMYGFSSEEEAKKSYLSNYSKDWKGLGNITKVSKEEFKKWVDSSHRKTKPFADYQSVKPLTTIEDLIKQANGSDENAKKAQDILKSRGIDWTNKTVKGVDAKRLKEIKDAKYDLMKAKRELSVATSKNSPYTESEIEDKRKLVKDAEERLNKITENKPRTNRNGTETEPKRNRKLTEGDNLEQERENIIDKAKNDGTYMKAPNGKDSNLNENQWVTVRTKPFKDWFGDWENDPDNASKVVDEHGEPLVVHHGTDDKFTEFKPDEMRDREGSFFFAENKQGAEGYSGSGNTIPVFVNIRNPFDYENGEIPEKYKNEWNSTKNKREQVGVLKKLGYDGFISDFENGKGWGEISAFYPNQIKSVDNKGKFDVYNDDIRFRNVYHGTDTMPIGKKTEDQISSIKSSVDSVSDKLGGMPVNYVDESNIPDNVKGRVDSTTKGWYDPKDGSVTLYIPNITSEDDAVRTVFHEKLGHEGLKALFGSDSEVNKFGDFIFKSANKELRNEIAKEAGRNGFPMNNPDGMSHASQEVFARIAEEGPASEHEFSLWRKVKHYIIDLLNKSGLHIKGILSDEDLRYYIQKTAESLKNQKPSEGSSEVMFRKEGEPKKMKGENMRQFIDRLREWNKIEDAKMDKDDPIPEYHPLDSGDFAKDSAAQNKYYDDYRQWKIRHNIYDIEKADGKFYNGEDDVIADPVKDKDIYLNSMDNSRLEADPKSIERYAKTDIIERRKLINGSAAEDSLFMKDISDRTDSIAKSFNGNITGKDIRESLPFMIEGTYQGPIKVNNELSDLMNDIKSWHDELYNFLKEEGLYGEVGYLNNYISHIWDSEKSDAKAFDNFIRTKNKYLQHRLVPTYQDGIDLGLVPKYKDITEIMAEYGKTCAESVANNRLINAFKNYDIVDGDRRDPALSTISAPGYTRISVPGISDYPMSDIWVHNSIKDRFNSVFGSKRTQGIPEWVTKTAHTFDLSASVMKKINLSVSGFHAVALAETLVGTEGPARALKDIAKYVIKESAFKGLPPAYAHPEDYKLAAKHLVRLGATDDYSMAEVQAITSKMRKIVEDFDKKHPKLSDNPATFVAQTLDFMNKGFDTVLWKYIHDGFKLSGFNYYAKGIDKDFRDGKINGIERDKRLDEAGQMINDAFGGQFWDVINISPALLKWMGRGLLSPDWTISTTRHGLSAMFGLGSLYSESGFQHYLFNNSKRLLGKDIPKNEYVDMRKKWGRQFYAIAFMAIGTMMNAINAYYRHKDEEGEKAKADEMRKSNPDYKSPYELAYPDGMTWYDYTMFGNSVGHETHLFSGHYQDGTETYVRWGKQLREIPEMLYGRDGFSFPGPIIDRLSGKANPIINLTSNLFSGASLNGFDNPYMKNKRGWAKEIGRLYVIASCFLPYSIPTDEEKQFKMTDLFMPSQKGMTKWSTINHFKTAILSGDLDYVGQTYKAAVLNGIDAEACLKAATTEVKAGQRKEMSDGVKSLQIAMESFDKAQTLDEKKHLKSKIVKYLADSGYKSFSQQEAVDMVKDYLNGDDLKDKEVNSDKYIMASTSVDIRDDYKISALSKKSREITNKVQDMYADGESPETIQQYISHYKKWFEIKGITAGYKSQSNSLKKLIGKDKNAMNMIRSCREETMKRINSVN